MQKLQLLLQQPNTSSRLKSGCMQMVLQDIFNICFPSAVLLLSAHDRKRSQSCKRYLFLQSQETCHFLQQGATCGNFVQCRLEALLRASVFSDRKNAVWRRSFFLPFPPSFTLIRNLLEKITNVEAAFSPSFYPSQWCGLAFLFCIVMLPLMSYLWPFLPHSFVPWYCLFFLSAACAELGLWCTSFWFLSFLLGRATPTLSGCIQSWSVGGWHTGGAQQHLLNEWIK